MSESLDPQIAEASSRIINGQEGEAYSVMSLVAPRPPEFHIVVAEPIFASSVYMLPDYVNPRLHKASMILGDTTDDVATHHIQPHLDYLSRNQNFYNPDGFRGLSWRVRAACEELEATEEDRQRPFRILGTSAIYMMDKTSYMYQFYSREFINALVEQMDPLPGPEQTSEAVYQRMYAAETEHKLDLPPFEKWMWQKFDEINQRLARGADMKTQAAMADAQNLLLPLDTMPPMLRAQLFEPSYE